MSKVDKVCSQEMFVITQPNTHTDTFILSSANSFVHSAKSPQHPQLVCQVGTEARAGQSLLEPSLLMLRLEQPVLNI